MLKRLTWLAMDRPKTTLAVILGLTMAFALQFPKIHIDTDPENMLEADQPDRMLMPERLSAWAKIAMEVAQKYE